MGELGLFGSGSGSLWDLIYGGKKWENNVAHFYMFYITTICLYNPGPGSCWQPHIMEIYSNPLINGIIQHTFTINFFFGEKFQVMPLN